MDFGALAPEVDSGRVYVGPRPVRGRRRRRHRWAAAFTPYLVWIGNTAAQCEEGPTRPQPPRPPTKRRLR